MRIDLGCGRNKHMDCFGIDAAPSPCTDLVHDYKYGIPLPDNSATFLIACRSLEYSDDFMHVMSEIYRVCRHKAFVCIVAPYAQSALHLANPAIKTLFNECTPFYLTPKRFHKDLFPEMRHTPQYMSEEDPVFDFRLLRMEFFYFPYYLTPFYDPDEREQLLQFQLNVVDEIMYHFVVVKQPLTQNEWQDIAGCSLEEPLRIMERRKLASLLEAQNNIDETSDAQSTIPNSSADAPADLPHPVFNVKESIRMKSQVKKRTIRKHGNREPTKQNLILRKPASKNKKKRIKHRPKAPVRVSKLERPQPVIGFGTAPGRKYSAASRVVYSIKIRIFNEAASD